MVAATLEVRAIWVHSGSNHIKASGRTPMRRLRSRSSACNLNEVWRPSGIGPLSSMNDILFEAQLPHRLLSTSGHCRASGPALAVAFALCTLLAEKQKRNRGMHLGPCCLSPYSFVCPVKQTSSVSSTGNIGKSHVHFEGGS